jgi:hypothetical protein
VALVLSTGLAALVLATIGELGLSLLALGLAGALLANQAFEWLTNR